MQNRPSLHIPTLLYLLMSAIGLVISLTSAGIMFLSGIVAKITGESNDVVFTNFALGWTLALVMLLLIPGMYLSLNRLLHKPVAWFGFAGKKWLWFAAGTWLVMFILGVFISDKDAVNWLIIPPITTLLIALPLWIWLRLGSKGINPNKHQAPWSVLGASLMVTPALVTLLEIAVLFLLGLMVLVFFAISPERLQQLEALIQQLSHSNMDPVLLLRVIQPVLQEPWVIFGIFSLTSVIIPMVEELFKPLWVWVFVKDITPTRGFFYGMICGAAFALLESLGYLASPLGGDWPVLLVGRVGTGILHTGTSGLVGWGLASAWSGRKYIRLAGSYFLAVFIHGLWNAFGLLMGLAEYIEPVNQLNVILSQLGSIAPAALFVLSACLIGIILYARKVNPPELAALPEGENIDEIVITQQTENE